MGKKKKRGHWKHDGKVTVMLLVERAEWALENGYQKPRWIHFCELLFPLFQLHLYEAKTTRSKYIWIRRKENGKAFKVRFSDHRPNAQLERDGDCDFIVGARHMGRWRTTGDAVEAVEEFFGVKVKRVHIDSPVSETVSKNGVDVMY